MEFTRMNGVLVSRSWVHLLSRVKEPICLYLPLLVRAFMQKAEEKRCKAKLWCHCNAAEVRAVTKAQFKCKSQGQGAAGILLLALKRCVQGPDSNWVWHEENKAMSVPSALGPHSQMLNQACIRCLVSFTLEVIGPFPVLNLIIFNIWNWEG